VTKSGLEPFLEVPLYGRAFVVKSFRPDGVDTDLLAILTEKSDFFVLRYDSEHNELITLISVNVASNDSLPTKIAQLLAINASLNIIAIHVSIGLIELIGFDVRGPKDIYFKKPSRVKISELEIYDLGYIDALDRQAVPTLAVLHKMPLKLPQVKTYRICEHKNSQCLEPAGYTMSEISDDANIITRVGLPRGGFLVIGSKKIVYTNPTSNVHRQLVIVPAFFTCISPIDSDGFRFLLGASSGDLHILLLLPGGQSNLVNGLRLEKLGKLPTIASCLTHIDDGIVYVGSQYGDSILIKLCSDPMTSFREPNGSIIQQYFQVLETYQSLAPINDVCILSQSKLNRQDQFVVATGVAHAGALRVISSGIEAVPLLQADIEERNVVGLFCYPEVANDNSLHCIHLVTSFSTRSFSLNCATGELEERTYGINSDESSLWIQRFGKNNIVQVTATMILNTKIDSKPRSTGAYWRCPDGVTVKAAVTLSSSLLIYTSDGYLRVMALHSYGAAQVSELKVAEEVASLASHRNEHEYFVTISYWESQRFGFITFGDNFKVMNEHFVDYRAESLVRSSGYLYANHKSQAAVFGTGDGKVLVCSTPDDECKLLEVLSLGQGPVFIYSLDDPSSVLANCDNLSYLLTVKPTGGVSKYVISNMSGSIHALSKMQMIDFTGFIYHSDNMLTFSTLECSKVPQLHIKSYSVGKSIHKLVRLAKHGLIATIQHNFPIMAIPVEHWPMLRSELVLYDDQTFEAVDRYELRSGNELAAVDINSQFSEMGWCLSAGKLDGLVDDNNQEEDCLVLGTGYCTNDPQFEKGRLLIFQICEGRKLCLTSSNEMGGAVKAIAICSGHVVASVNGLTVLYRWDYQLVKALIKASASGGHMDGTCISHLGNILAVGEIGIGIA